MKEGRVKRRVDEGNERGKDRTRHGRREGKEEVSGGGIEREREGAWEQGREGNFKGGSIFTNQPFTNRPLPLRLGAYALQGTRAKPGNHLVYYMQRKLVQNARQANADSPMFP